MKYKTKPIEVEAIQYNGSNREAVEMLLASMPGWDVIQRSDNKLIVRPSLRLEKFMIIDPGDWIIREDNGVSCAENEDFLNNYELV